MYKIVTLLIIIIDQFSKKVIRDNINFGQTICLVKNKLYLTRAENKGAAYGFLKNNTKILTFFSFISMAMLIKFFKENKKGNSLMIAVVIGGVIGNQIDRIKRKSVTDFMFLKIKNTPIFNFADLAILIGILNILANIFLNKNNDAK